MSEGRFRFGLHFWQLPVDSWVDQVRHYEQLGFSSITFTDHQVVPQWEPLTALAAVAAVTDTVRVGTLVLDMALRNPVLTAKSAATVERLSGGRLELGLGAGYVAKNFAAAGVPFPSAMERIARAGGVPDAHAPALDTALDDTARPLLPGDRRADGGQRVRLAVDPRRWRWTHDDAPGRPSGRHRLRPSATRYG